MPRRSAHCGGTPLAHQRRRQIRRVRMARTISRALVSLMLVILALALCLVTTHAGPNTARRMHAVDLGTFEGLVTEPVAVNDRGQVAGWYVVAYNHLRSFFWDGRG